MTHTLGSIAKSRCQSPNLIPLEDTLYKTEKGVSVEGLIKNTTRSILTLSRTSLLFYSMKPGAEKFINKINSNQWK